MSIFTSDNLFLGQDKTIFTYENNFLVHPKSKLSDIKQTYIDIGNGQKFELSELEIPFWWLDYMNYSLGDTSKPNLETTKATK